jgi:hypothetical protein
LNSAFTDCCNKHYWQLSSMKTAAQVKRRDEAAELYHHPGVTQAKRPKIHSLAKEGTIDLKRVRNVLAGCLVVT